MKKVFVLWIVLALLLMFVNVTVGAEEIDEIADVDEIVSDIVATDEPKEDCTITETETDVPEITDEMIEEVGAEIYNTIFNRVFEFLELHRDTIILVAGFVGSIFLSYTEARRKKKADKDLNNKQSEILADILGVTSSQNGVIDVANALLQGYAEMKEKYQQYENIEDDRNKIVGAVMVQNATILDFLVTVYANSNLPQGVKDIVSLKYARCNKALDDDEKLKSLVLAVQNIIKGQDETGIEEKEA